jgi:signal transduction histidine kinase
VVVVTPGQRVDLAPLTGPSLWGQTVAVGPMHENSGQERSAWLGRLAWLWTSCAAVVASTLSVVWAVTGAGYFWPAWVWLGAAAPVGSWRVLRWHWGCRAPGQRAMRVHTAISVLLSTACVTVWLLSGLGYFWPFWPLLGLGVALVLHVVVRSSLPSARENALAERVGTLSRSRRGVLEVHTAELQRLERDLHDGAQARLVSLGMSLGMAEDLLDSDPVAARKLLAEARGTAVAALGDLRDLVRGIQPPVLADRGLEGAIRALVLTVPVAIDLELDPPPARLPAPVESAAYFAVAEAVTNMVKHSNAASGWVQSSYSAGRLSIVVGDTGHGGADPALGTGLQGIERRLAAFDGTLSVCSPVGGPTVVRVEVPCEPLSLKT